MKNFKKPGKLKAALLEWMGVPISLMDTEFWRHFGNTNVAGQVVNEKTVLQLSAVWSCVRLIAETISTLPLQLYERTADGRKPANQHPLYNIIHTQPNIDSTATVFWEALIVAMLMHGNGMAEMRFIGSRFVALNFLVPARLKTSRVHGKIEYRYTDCDGKQRVIPPNRIFRVPGFTLNGDWGVSAIEYGAGVFGSALAASNAANSTFEKGLMPTIAYSLPGKIDPLQRKDFKQLMRDKTGSLNSGEPIILEQGMTAAPLGINSTDAQLLESRNFSVEDICRWFRVPPFMVGHTAGSTNWGTGIEQQMIGFMQFTLRPWLTRIEQAIGKDLLAPEERGKFYAEFSVEGLLRADSAGRAEYYAKMTSNGLMTRDEARSKENLAPKGGNAEVLTVQVALTPLDKLGQTPVATTTQVPPDET